MAQRLLRRGLAARAGAGLRPAPGRRARRRRWALPDQPGEPGPGLYRRPFEYQTLLPPLSSPHTSTCPTGDARIRDRPRAAVRRRRRAVRRRRGRARRSVAILQRPRGHGSDYGVPLRVADPARVRRRRHRFGQDEHDLPLLAERRRAPACRSWSSSRPRPSTGRCSPTPSSGRGCGCSPPGNGRRRAPPAQPVRGSGGHDRQRASRPAARGVRGRVRHVDAAAADPRAVPARGVRRPRVGPAHEHERPARRRRRRPRPPRFPTLTDLVAKVAEVVPTPRLRRQRSPATCGPRSSPGSSRCAAAARARCSTSPARCPTEELLAGPDRPRARGDGRRRRQGVPDGAAAHPAGRAPARAGAAAPACAHLLVVEEAHRLLANVPARGRRGAADPRGRRSRRSRNLLSEIRAYGQGVVIADQVPVRLAPDVIKNTDLKIAHRRSSRRRPRRRSPAPWRWTSSQARALTILERRRGRGVQRRRRRARCSCGCRSAKDPLSRRPRRPTTRSRGTWRRWRAERDRRRYSCPEPFCAETCAGAPEACEAARDLAADEYVQRDALADGPVHDRVSRARSTGCGTTWSAVLRARRPPTVDEEAAAALVRRATVPTGWPTAAARRACGPTPTPPSSATGCRRSCSTASRRRGDARPALVGALQETAHRLHRAPVRAVSGLPSGLHTGPAAVPVPVRRRRPRRAAGGTDRRGARRTSSTRPRKTTGAGRPGTCARTPRTSWSSSRSETPAELNEAVDVAARRACLCFEQQMLADDSSKVPRTSRRILARVVSEAGL